MTITKEWCQTEYQEQESENYHRPLDEEYIFYNAVKTGDMETINKNCETNEFTNPSGVGILSKNSITNIKYHFIVTAALVTRYCIEGGLESELAYRLSDFYILKMDSATTIAQIVDLHHIMVKDFTGKMRLLQKQKIISKPVMQCVDYIYNHIRERITLQDLAEHTGLSTSYLSRVFKFNLGISISDYIREKKIEKAIHLLRYSDKPLIEIAIYLSFASQSHFIQAFESYTGLTPKKYRDKFYKSMW